MRILISGHAGYVGAVLMRHLRARFPAAHLIGYDSRLFAACLTAPSEPPERLLDRQVIGDARDLPPASIEAGLLEGVDAVICLAAVSNDPMGTRFAAVTDAINHQAAVRLALAARDAGVRHFAFASSCSVYGAASAAPRTEHDPVLPLTAYARSKIDTETALRDTDLGGMTVTCLRFATACGMSDRLRLDLVLNDFVACAMSAGEITVLSDGSPWRPLIDVTDMARAVEWAITRPAAAGGGFLVVNTGGDGWNFQVRDLAHAVAAELPGTRVSINQAAPPDLRSYRVDFARFAVLAPDHQPRMTLAGSIRRLRDGLAAIGFADAEFRRSSLVRLNALDAHIRSGRLDEELRWRGPPA